MEDPVLRLKEDRLNGEKGFDIKVAGKACFNHRVKPNIKENRQNHQKAKGRRKRMSNREGYKNRFGVGGSFA